MANIYSYQGRDAAGRAVSGELMAESGRAAAKLLLAQGVFVTGLAERSKGGRGPKALLRYLCHGKYVMLFCRELAVTVSAGMTVHEALLMLAEEEQGRSERKLLQELADKVQGGSTLTTALSEHEDYFSDTVCYMVAVGEHSGRLGELLLRLARQLEKEYEAREKLLTLMLYPLVLFAVTLLTVGFMIHFILPVFASFFTELQTELPWPTRLVMGAGELLSAYGLLLPPVALLGLLTVYLLLQREEIRLAAEKAALRLPVVGRLLIHTELARFAGMLSVLLRSGVVIDRALELLQEITGSVYLRQGIMRVCEDVRRGGQLSRSLQRLQLFPRVQLGLLHAGEETGTLDEVLDSLAKFAEREADTTAERLKILLEPLMIIVLGGIVGTIVMAIALPILESMTLLSY